MTAWRRLPFLMLGGLAMLAGLATGEARLGWDFPGMSIVHMHGPLMICAFLGTVISLERAVALKARWAYAAPFLAGLGGLAAILGLQAAPSLLVLASVVFCTAAAVVVRRQPALFTAVLFAGGLSWLAGNLGWLAGLPVPDVVAWWAAFLVLTIAGERLELSRFMKPGRWRTESAVLVVAVVLAAPALGTVAYDLMWRVFGLGLVLMTAWMLRNDIARKTIAQPGLTRYVAVCLFAGYVWLGAAGAMAMVTQVAFGGLAYDAVLHAIFIGFVFSMIFGHAPVILPAVLRVRVPFLRLYYLPLALLHATLAARVAGDLLALEPWRAWGGLLNGLVILAWIVTTASATVVATRRRAAESQTAAPVP